MDRIDVHIAVRRIPPGEVLATGHGTSSEELRRDVLRARSSRRGGARETGRTTRRSRRRRLFGPAR